MVWQSLVNRWRQQREDAALARRAIPDLLWRRTLKRFPFLPRTAQDGEPELRRLTSLFLDSKEFSGARGLVVSDDMAVAIAAQACLPILQLGLQTYGGFVGIVVHPGQARVRRESTDDDGIVHEYEEVLSGEAMEGGPVMLSWRDVRGAGASAALGYNVVVHEFAHVLDMADGLADGVPLLPASIARADWVRCLGDEYAAFCLRVDAEVPTALDPYGAESPGEFFAVASEAFFVAPAAMREEHPALFERFIRFYRQDPSKRDGGSGA
ncbi:MAG TPA: M90 family metallopeptidase [Rubrivivax sp.]